MGKICWCRENFLFFWDCNFWIEGSRVIWLFFWMEIGLNFWFSSMWGCSNLLMKNESEKIYKFHLKVAILCQFSCCKSVTLNCLFFLRHTSKQYVHMKICSTRQKKKWEQNGFDKEEEMWTGCLNIAFSIFLMKHVSPAIFI